MFFGMLTIDNDGFSMVLGLSNHWFQWFSMVKDHWSNDGMVSMDRTGLLLILLFLHFLFILRNNQKLSAAKILISFVVVGAASEFGGGQCW